MSITVDEQPERTRSSAFRSRESTDREYLRFTDTTWFANQHKLRSGSHSPASFPLFWWRFTPGLARVRLSRSEANLRFVAASIAHIPLSCASEVATMCSMSVSLRSEKVLPV